MNQGQFIISAPPSQSGVDEELDDAPDAGPEVELREVVAAPEHHGERLDRTLAGLVPEFSRSYLQQLIEMGAVSLNGASAVKPATRLRAGDRVVVELRPTPQTQAFQPQAMTLSVVYEDEHLCVIDKPAGLVVHPAPGNWSGTLLNGLLARDLRANALPRAGIVHRLDKDTSGLMVVARSREAMEALVRSIAAREVSRRYLALGHRPWSGAPSRRVDAPIGRDPRNRLRMAVVDLARHPGKPASTRIDLLQNSERGCLVRCTLETGRTHQIRVHMASLGHPLVADVLYGGFPAAGLERQALHAYRLAFVHPLTGESLDFRSPLPPDLQAALSEWRLSYNQSQ